MINSTIKAGIASYSFKMGSNILTVHFVVLGKEVGGIVFDRKGSELVQTGKGTVCSPFVSRAIQICDGLFVKLSGNFLK